MTDKEYQRIVSKRLKNQKFLIYSRDAEKEEDEDENGTTQHTIDNGNTFGIF